MKLNATTCAAVDWRRGGLWLLVILLFVQQVPQGVTAGKRSSNGAAGNARPRATTSTTSTQSSIVPEEWRDPYVYSLFEITLSAIESKLRRVDNLERSMEQMMARLSENAVRSDAILAQLKNMDGRLNRMATASGSSAGAGASSGSGSSSVGQQFQQTLLGGGGNHNLEPRILALDEKVSLIGSKLNVLANQLDSNSLLWATGLGGQNDTAARLLLQHYQHLLLSQSQPLSSNSNDRSSDGSIDDYATSSSEQTRTFVLAPIGAGAGNSAAKRPDRADRHATTSRNANSSPSGPVFGVGVGVGTNKVTVTVTPTPTTTESAVEDVESLRTTMGSMDRHLKILIELFSEQMDRIMGAVAEVRTVVVTAASPTQEPSTVLATSTTEPTPLDRSSSSSGRISNSKLDALYQKMTPLLDVTEKMDQVWNVLVGAKNSVDSLLPTSEALLWQTQRQERALSDIHAELNIKTKQIIDNLNQIQQQQQRLEPGTSGSSSSGSSMLTKRSKNEGPDGIVTKPQESQQVHVTFKQSTSISSSSSGSNIELPSSRNVPSGIRVQELSPGPVVAAVLAAAKSTNNSTTTTTTTTTTTPLPPPPPEVAPIPSDIMDSEFLHDEPVVGQQKKPTNQTNSLSSSSNGGNGNGNGRNKTLSSSSSSFVAAAAANGNLSTTTGRSVQQQHIAPAGPTERSRIPTNSAVIFPSLKNKPGFTNSTFFYDYTTPQNIRGYSCAELKEQGLTKSGIYYLLIRGTSFWYIKVYCDMEAANGGWTVIQRRDDYGGDNRENFNRDWDDYKSGFGDPDREFWLGNENIYMLTNAEDYSLRVELEDFEGNKKYAEYSSFKLYSEREQYKLEIGGYTGNAGDSLNDPWYGSNLSPFSTYNRDNDRSSLNCASMLKGGWWWKSCGRGLNGIYLTDPQDLTARQGIVWFRWRGWDYTLKRATMMIRPRHYGKEPSTPSPQ